MCTKKIVNTRLTSGLVIFIIIMIVILLVQFVLPFDIAKLGGIRAMGNPLMMLFFLSSWALGFAMSLVYSQLGNALKGNYIRKGKKFGMLMWIIASFPPIFIVYTSMAYPLGFFISEIVASLIYMPLAAITIVKIIDKK